MSVRTVFLLLTSLAVLFSSCPLIDLSKLEITSLPAEADAVLEAGQNITISFSQDVRQSSIESLFKLSGVSGIEEGDFSWDGPNLEFIPNCGLRPGFRYRLKINGDIECTDGRTFTENINIPFYYITDDLPPVLESFSPPRAAIVGVNQNLMLTFSKPIAAESFSDGFTLSPDTDYEIEWDDDQITATISPENKWLNLQYYSWSLSDEITDQSEIVLAGETSGSFLVQLDTHPPDITGMYPASDNDDGSFTILRSLEPDQLLQGMHLAIAFSEEIDFPSLRQNFSIDPSINGYLLSLGPDSVLYYIDEELPPEGSYEVTITGALEDISGNTMMSEWSLLITPDIPAQQIIGVDIEGSSGTHSLASSDFNTAGFIEIPGLDYYDAEKLHFIVNLSSGFPESDGNGRLGFESTIGVTTIFPPGISSPAVYTTSWESETRLRLIYEDFSSCAPDEPIYYRFRINTGGPGSSTPDGSYLLDEIEFIFLAESE